MVKKLNRLMQLESESVFILREAAAQFEKTALLFSGGKDSIVMAHLAKKAFAPGRIPFPFVHIDTGHNFPETLAFRDQFCQSLGVELVTGSVQDTINRGLAKEEKGPLPSRNAIQSVTLLETIDAYHFDACLGGGRRDEEKSRAKERIFSHRDSFGQWEPKNQRPELWNLFNGLKDQGEHFRIFPLSDWTEMDIWEYIQKESIHVPSLYFSHLRDVIVRKGIIYSCSELFADQVTEEVQKKFVRFRTIGDITCTGAVESFAADVDQIISELRMSRTTERGSRADDRRSEAAMEDRKKQGYF